MYKCTSGWPQRISDGAFVNPDTDAGYLEWISKGNSPSPCESAVFDAREMRAAAYKEESDNIFMEAIFDGCNEKMNEWKAKVEEIKSRHPIQQ